MTQAPNISQDRPPKGYFKYILAVDSETTGLNKVKNEGDVSDGHQAVSWGLIVADAETLIPVEKLYLEVKWNEQSKRRKELDPEFGVTASSIHGLSYSYLEENGIDEADAVVQILELILKYWGPTNELKCLGHNVSEFDIPFMKSMFKRYGVDVKFANRQYDTNSIGWAMTGSFTSDAFFSTMGFDTRESHNSLEDASMALESTRRLRVIWNDSVGLKAYE